MESESLVPKLSSKQRRRQRGFEHRRSIDDALHFASSCLKRAGFVLAYVSRSDVSCYYTYPGRIGLIRVSDHTKKSREREVLGPIAASITFSPGQLHADGFLHMTEEQIEHLAVVAVGRFILRTERAPLDK